MGGYYELWRKMQERTLFHGTVVDNEPTILRHGLVGGWHGRTGPFVGHAYGDQGSSEDDEIVFLADKQGLDRAVTAMTFHVARKLGKSLHDVTDTDLRNHGLLVISRDHEPGVTVQHADEDDPQYAPRPFGVEDGDWYAPEAGADATLRGAALVRFLRRFRALPRDWGAKTPFDSRKARRDLLGALVSKDPRKDRNEIAARVAAMSDEQVAAALHWET